MWKIITLITLSVAFLILLGFTISSCTQDKNPYTIVPLPDGNVAKVAKGQTLSMKVVGTPGKAGSSYSRIENDQMATSVGLDSSGNGLPKLDMGKMPSIKSGTISAGSGFSYVVEAAKAGATILFVIGAICIIGGGVLAYFTKSFTPLLYIGGAGVLIILTAILVESYPWVVLIGAGGAFILVAYWFYSSYIAKKTTTAVTQVVAGNETFKTNLSTIDFSAMIKKVGDATIADTQTIVAKVLEVWKNAQNVEQDTKTQAVVTAVK
jgi:hypothetical protein